ncbi:MAG TPA: DUF4172 domain-containing protein [Chlamydiales bacterium]|jgi:Fic family protein|nr:DUF4172 domain-containing protein [Chlamydiales bacterium]
MPWNWELPDWPNFVYDLDRISPQERQFLLAVGSSFAYLKTIETEEYNRFLVEILSVEGLESSRIEGEILDRESLQSSIQQHFGLQTLKRPGDKEAGMAQLLCSVYESFDEPLTHEMLWQWHATLFKETSSLMDCGRYRTHKEPMQIVSNRYGSPVVFFEAPPSSSVFQEMTAFIEWFNSTTTSGSILVRAAIAHVYFESIHPFEDGNGRIGRVLSEKILSQGLGRPLLIAISKMLEKRKKEYYSALERCNRTLEIQDWVDFFGSVILQAQEESMRFLYFIIEKSKMLTALSGQINPRQTKALLRMFEEGLSGFINWGSKQVATNDASEAKPDQSELRSRFDRRRTYPKEIRPRRRIDMAKPQQVDCHWFTVPVNEGGLSAEKYIAITKTTRATATRDLADLVEKGALVKTGELRHTRYWLNLPMNGPVRNG